MDLAGREKQNAVERAGRGSSVKANNKQKKKTNYITNGQSETT